ncbi:DUF4384 domain-containing protein [Mameliella alba]|nr:DUF4384 domain-containing protein [Mameliella alba]MBY6170186.1 DUF4384 domain-containing protein [Mameliella alba]MBY6174837.1 DUF4384 domain-containing protein [Mameliella alba]
MTRLTDLLSALLMLALLVVLPQRGAAQADVLLGAQLCHAAEGQIPAGSTIALAPPLAAETPLPVPEIEAIMSRAAQEMCADWQDKPRILAGSAELRASLALVLNRQGTAAWQQTIQSTLRQEADFVLVGETGFAGGAVTLRLTLVDLADGRVIVKTSDAPLGGVTGQTGGDPRAAIGAAIRQFLDMLPEARDQITIGAFVNEASGLETPVGRALADIAVEAWLDAANSVTALLRDAPPARVLRGARPANGYYLGGYIRLIDSNRFQLVLRLSQDGALRASRTLDLSSLRMPAHLRALLDPDNMNQETGLDGLAAALAAMGRAQLRMTATGGRAGTYPVCTATDPARVPADCADSLMHLSLMSDRDGALLCLSLDETGQFFIILPAEYAPDLRLTAGQPLVLPDDLPPLPGGNRIYWPAMGPPAETLLGCLLYRSLPASLIRALEDLDGLRLTPADRLALLAILRDADPLAGAAARVRIIGMTRMK